VEGEGKIFVLSNFVVTEQCNSSVISIDWTRGCQTGSYTPPIALHVRRLCMTVVSMASSGKQNTRQKRARGPAAPTSTPATSKSKPRAARPAPRGAGDDPAPDDDPSLPSGWELLDREAGASRPLDLGDTQAVDGEAKKTKHQKKSEKKRKEEGIRDLESRRKAGLIAPRTAPEFEQMIMSSPNSSYVWIQFMAYLIAQGELEKARATAQRAVKTITFREQDEKFNVYMAWLNAEIAYGNEESTDEVFKMAMSLSSQSKVLKTALDIFELAGKTARAQHVAKTLCKLYGDAPESWIRVIRFYLKQGDANQANVHYGKSLQALHPRHHVHMATQAALLEFKLGDPERGRSIMERVLMDNPKRLDLWNVYLDQEVKHGESQRTRALYGTYLTASISLHPSH
jgi:rRNA biogenesis protein RRP5